MKLFRNSQNIIFAFILTLLFLSGMSPIHANLAKKQNLAATSTNSATQHATVIVLDMSGSMGGSGGNDPNGIRCSAANAYIDLSGPGNYIGIVDLDDPTGQLNGPDNFNNSSILAPLTNMSTQSARIQLRQELATKTHNCAPDADTPTYSALYNAENMLLTATTANPNLTGSVILLTDGIPYPESAQQIAAINSQLLPQFRAHNWPIDVIGLGPQTPQGGIDFHGFLTGIANATSGRFFDDSHGVINGQPSPLNIMPFFVEIFSLRNNNRSPGSDIPLTTLNGGTVSQDFDVGQYLSHLDVIALKDTPSISFTLVAPNGATLPPQVSGTFISQDPHYTIFSIDGPQAGTWTLNATGTGNILMNSLLTSTLQLQIVAPLPTGQATPLFPLGYQFEVAATIKDNQGNQIEGGAFTLHGTLQYVGDTTLSSPINIILSDSQSPGIYKAVVTVPSSDPPGVYQLTINVSQISSFSLTAQQTNIDVEIFPTPYLLDAKGKPTENTVNNQVIQWDPALQFLYSLPIIKNFAFWPLNNLPAKPETTLKGQLIYNNKPYNGAKVTGSAYLNGSNSHTSASINVTNEPNGYFTVNFPAFASGTYTIHFLTAGNFKDSYGLQWQQTQSANLTVMPAATSWEMRAWLVTLFYLILLFIIALIFRFPFLPSPKIAYSVNGEKNKSYTINTFRWPWQAIWQRNIAPKPIKQLNGLIIRVKRGGIVEAKINKSALTIYDEKHKPLDSKFRTIRSLSAKETTYEFTGSRVKNNTQKINKANNHTYKPAQNNSISIAKSKNNAKSRQSNRKKY